VRSSCNRLSYFFANTRLFGGGAPDASGGGAPDASGGGAPDASGGVAPDASGGVGDGGAPDPLPDPCLRSPVIRAYFLANARLLGGGDVPEASGGVAPDASGGVGDGGAPDPLPDPCLRSPAELPVSSSVSPDPEDK